MGHIRHATHVKQTYDVLITDQRLSSIQLHQWQARLHMQHCAGTLTQNKWSTTSTKRPNTLCTSTVGTWPTYTSDTHGKHVSYMLLWQAEWALREHTAQEMFGILQDRNKNNATNPVFQTGTLPGRMGPHSVENPAPTPAQTPENILDPNKWEIQIN